MNPKLKRWICATLTLSLLLGTTVSARARNELPRTASVQQDEADLESGGGELFSALTPDVMALEATAGYLHSSFSSTIYEYKMTLGPEESGFSLAAMPVETAFPPTMELFLDGEAYDSLTVGQPSRFIEVGPGQKRTVVLRSTSHTDGYVKEYRLEVYRTSTRFDWVVGEPQTLPDGGSLVAVTLTAPTALEMKTLSFSLGFDPAVLQLAKPTGETATTVGQCVTNAEGFKYDAATRKGYFATQRWVLDNKLGILTMEYGAQSTSATKPPYLVEPGKEGVATVYFRLNGELKPDSLFVRASEDSPRTGISVIERVNGEDITSANTGMARMVGLPEPEPVTYMVTLPATRADGGSVEAQPNQTVFQAGAVLTLTAVPDRSYAFSGWDGLPAGAAVQGARAIITVNRDLDLSGVTARFAWNSPFPAADGVDTAPPYEGKYVLSVGSGEIPSLMSTEETGVSQLGEDKNGLMRLEHHEELGTDSEAPRARLNSASYGVGAVATFQTRNLSGTGANWVGREFILKRTGSGINLWFEQDNLMQVTESQFDQLLASFQQSVEVMVQDFGAIYDRNGNGKLDVLLYDIQDGYTAGVSGSYYAGLTNAAELYRGVGNQMDAVHLDTYPAMGGVFSRPEISTVMSTMAHETQHLVMYSTFKRDVVEGGINNAQLTAKLPPTWVNEGLSQAVEHKLFGTLSSRVATFNSSNLIQKGYSLTDWQGTVENYALAYLFVEYLNVQAELGSISGFLKQFYTDYSGGADKVLERILQSVPNLDGLSFDDTVACWYAAMLLQQDSGVYGYGGDDSFRTVNPRAGQSPPAGLPRTAGVYTKLTSAYIPAENNGMTHLGLTPRDITLIAIADKGGSVIRSPSRAAYSKGEYVTLTATPEPGYVFEGWTGDVNPGLAGDHTITVVMDRFRTLHAAFGVESPSIDPPQEQPVIPEALLDGAEMDEAGLSATIKSEQGSAVLTKADGSTLTGLKNGDSVVFKANSAAGMRFAGWQLRATPLDSLESASVEGDPTLVMENPWTTTARTGVSVSAVFEADAPQSKLPELGSMEVSGAQGRQLICGEGDSAGRFGYYPDTHTYDLWLLPGETGVSLALESEATVETLTATGAAGTTVSLQAHPYDKGGVRWKEGEQDLLLTLGENVREGTVTLTLTDEDGVTAKYIIRLHRVEKTPEVLLSEAEGAIVATVNSAEMYTVSLSLELPADTFPDVAGDTDVEDKLGSLPEGLTYSKAVVKNVENGQLLRLTVEAETGEPYKNPFSIKLFDGALADVGITDDVHNSFSDARFGGLYHTTHKAGQVTLSGTVTGYDASALPQITFEDESGGVITGQITVTGGAAYGRQTFEFTAPLELGKTYTMTVNKARHTGWTITDVVLRVDTQLRTSLTLYAGDLDGDNRVTVFDADMLSSGLGKSGCDLDGDGMATVFDLDILMGKDNYGGAGKKLEWSAAIKGSETR